MKCSGPNFNQCISCEGVLAQGICLDICPFGTSKLDNICQIPGNPIMVFDIEFESDGIYQDSINHIIALPIGEDGESINIEDLALPQLMRGIYMTGVGTLKIEQEKHGC